MADDRNRTDTKYVMPESSLQTIFEELPLNVFFKDTDGRYLLTSHLCNMLSGGDEHFDIHGKTDVDIQVDKALGERFLAEDLEIVRTGNEMRYQQEMVFSGESYYYEIYKKPVRGRDGEIIGILGTVTDLTDLIRTRQELERLSCEDAMTGAYNRSFLNKDQAEITQNRYPAAVILADGDNLKRINDLHGHDCGDRIILALYDNLSRNIGENDSIVRLGGDEFLIFCPDTDEEACRALIRRIKAGEADYEIEGVPLSASYGYSILKDADCPVSDAVRLADRMMYQQKPAARG